MKSQSNVSYIALINTVSSASSHFPQNQIQNIYIDKHIQNSILEKYVNIIICPNQFLIIVQKVR